MQTTQNTLPKKEPQAVIELYREALARAQAKVTHLQECLAILEAENSSDDTVSINIETR